MNVCHFHVADLVEEPTKSDSDEGKHITVRKTKSKKNRAEKASRLYVIPCKTHLTKAQKEIANRMAQKTHKGSDLFVKILTASNIHTYRTCILVCKHLISFHFLWLCI